LTKKSKIQLALEPLKTQLDFTKMFYEDNKADLTKEEEKAFGLKTKELERQYEQQKTLQETIGKLQISAASQGAPASVVQAIGKAKNVGEASAAAGVYSGDVLDRQYKLAQIAKMNADTIKVISESTPSTKQNTEAVMTINDINNILSSDAFDSTFGATNTIQRNLPGTNAYALTAQVNNMINKLALASRGELKGQGTVSDYEGRMLKEAQTALKLNLSPEQARKEMAKVRGALATSSGLKAAVKITNPKTGETSVVDANQAGITDAIKDGMQVEYQ
jgi:hypothetical protein